MTYHSWQTDDIRSHVKSGATTVDELRAEGVYQILTPDECVALADELGPTAAFTHHPLCGATSPDDGWESLELFADQVLPRIRAATERDVDRVSLLDLTELVAAGPHRAGDPGVPGRDRGRRRRAAPAGRDRPARRPSPTWPDWPPAPAQAGVPVVHCVAMRRDDGQGSNHNARLFLGMLKTPVPLRPGTPAVEVVPEIGVAESDLVLSRLHGLGPMGGTDLDPVLRNLGVTTIVGVGVSVNVAILNFAMDAVNNGYQFVIPRDAVAGVPESYAERRDRQHAVAAGHDDHHRRGPGRLAGLSRQRDGQPWSAALSRSLVVTRLAVDADHVPLAGRGPAP